MWHGTIDRTKDFSARGPRINSQQWINSLRMAFPENNISLLYKIHSIIKKYSCNLRELNKDYQVEHFTITFGVNLKMVKTTVRFFQ